MCVVTLLKPILPNKIILNYFQIQRLAGVKTGKSLLFLGLCKGTAQPYRVNLQKTTIGLGIAQN